MEYEVKITYKHIKRLYLRVKDNCILISAPFFTSKKTIDKMINDNKDFIEKNIYRQEIRKDNNLINFNDVVNILNNNYQIMLTNGKEKITEHFIFLHDNQDLRIKIKKLFKNRLYETMCDLTNYYFKLMGFNGNIPVIKIKDTKTKWGSYNKRNHELDYASELMFKDDECRTYLVVHELSHLVYYNHSHDFYNLVSKYCPDYKRIKNKLNGRN